MDWLKDFIERFEHYPELQNLKAKKFHGSVVLNFCDGVVQSFEYRMHGRAVKNIDGPNLTKGGLMK